MSDKIEFCKRLSSQKECLSRITFYYNAIQFNLWQIKQNKITKYQKISALNNSKNLYMRMQFVVDHAKINFPELPWSMPMLYEDFFPFEVEKNTQA